MNQKPYQKNFYQRQKLNITQLSDYYRELRKYQYENGIPIKRFSILWRKLIHILPLSLIKLDRVLASEHINIIGDKHTSDKNVIYAATHIGGNDTQRVFEIIRKHAYLVFGDPGISYRGMLGCLSFLNGAICLETRDKTDRRIAETRSVEILQKGGNLLIFPEGAFNIEPCVPVMKIFTGAVRISQKTGLDIVPIAVEQYGDTYYANIGKNIKYYMDAGSIKEKTEMLKNILASLKWEIWESQGIYHRSEIASMNKTEYAQMIIDKRDYGYTLKDALETRYHDDKHPDRETVFSFMDRLQPNMKNAFLFAKQI